MKHLSVKVEDETMAAMERIVELSDSRNLTYHVRQALRRYAETELPKMQRQQRQSGLLKAMLKVAPEPDGGPDVQS